MARLLFVTNHSDQQWLATLLQLQRRFHQVEQTQFDDDLLVQLKDHPPDVLFVEHDEDDCSAGHVIESVRASIPEMPIVFVSETHAITSTIEAMKAGAFDCLCKPLDVDQIEQVVEQALELDAQRRQCAGLIQSIAQTGVSDCLIGTSLAMRDVYKSIGRVASRDIPVLVTGESGTGKELVARAIHGHSQRSQQVFLALNCAAIPEQLLESELFGHERGAFSGAERRRVGRFEQANGGTLLLDEIGDMPLSLQAKMLRVLQDQTFERVGGSETIKTDVRIISSTHHDLKSLTAAGKFRNDLYYRLGVFNIHLPPLREREDDVKLLIYRFINQFGPKLNPEIRAISPQALAILGNYSWPGNVRELQSVLKQSLLQAHGPLLLPTMLPNLITPELPPSSKHKDEPSRVDLGRFLIRKIGSKTEGLYEEAHREFNRQLLPQVMEHTDGNLFQAARLLGIARQTLRRHLRELADLGSVPASRTIGVYHGNEVHHPDRELCSQVI
jgi:two-component system nitrogen regulation response regulator GlnG